MVFYINADRMKTPKSDLKSTCVLIHQYFPYHHPSLAIGKISFTSPVVINVLIRACRKKVSPIPLVGTFEQQKQCLCKPDIFPMQSNLEPSMKD